MPDKFKNKYRIPSARAAWWNYADNAAYFVTICTKNREHYFGEIIETQCIASLPVSDAAETQCIASLRATAIGNIVNQEWLKTPSIRPDMNLELDEFITMPNHFHAIIWIGENEYNRSPTNAPVNKFGPQAKNLSSIIRGFKSAVTTYATKNDVPFGWQSRFHDHIIRDEAAYQKIKHYIINNPQNWDSDKFNN